MCVLNGAGVYWWSSILSDLVHTDACHHVAHVPVCSVMKESELIKETRVPSEEVHAGGPVAV